MSASLNYPRHLAGELFTIQINNFISSMLPKEQINLTKWSHHCINSFVQAWQGSLLDDWPCAGVHVWGGLLQVQIVISLKELMFEIGFSRPHVAFPLSVLHCFSSNSIQRSWHSSQEATKRVQTKGYEAVPQSSLSVMQVFNISTATMNRMCLIEWRKWGSWFG